MNNRTQRNYMRAIIYFSCFWIIIAGCSKQQEAQHEQKYADKQKVSGEIFTRNAKNEIVRQSGAVIRFLTQSEHRTFETQLKEWRDKKYQADHQLWDNTYKDYKELLIETNKATDLVTNSLVREYRRRVPTDPRSNDELTLLFGAAHDKDGRYAEFPDFVKDYWRLNRPEKLEQMKSIMNGAKANIEEKIYDKQFPLNEDPIKQFLSSVYWTTANSEGKFNVLLFAEREYWVVSLSVIPPERSWYFRFVPDGTDLVLSDGNAVQ